MTGCSDRTDSPTVVDVQFAKGGGGTSVDAADPNSAPQDITLDVRVIGSGFDDGSVVKFLKGGQSSPKIVTNSSTFIDRHNIVANITIAVDAEVTLYDIEVTTLRGKKGMGSELFSVRKKGDTEPEFVVTATDLGMRAGSSSAFARSVVSSPDGTSVRVVGDSGDRPSYWAPGSGFVELVVAPPSDPDATVLDGQANDINDLGQVVGERYVQHSDPELSNLQPIFWSSSAEEGIVLPTQQARFVFVKGINNGGQVAGWASGHPQHPDQSHAMLWTVDGVGGATVRDLYEDFAALGLSQSIAEGINERGQIVGWAHDDGGREHAFLWDNGNVTLLDGEVEPGFQSFAYAVNNADPVQIVGGSHDQSGGSRRVLLWTILPGGTVATEELPPPAGFEWSWPTDLNDNGEAVGSSRPQNGQDDHATLWTFAPNTGDRVGMDLGVGGAYGIDDSASLVGLTRVVGATTIEEGKGRKKTRNPHAILWEIEPPGS
jgi:probable HAF family extracellular repeat protein